MKITSVHDSGAYFVKYVFECYFLRNNSSYSFLDSTV